MYWPMSILSAGLTTVFVRSAWPDRIVALGIAPVNAEREIYVGAVSFYLKNSGIRSIVTKSDSEAEDEQE
jgi:hypothetical protein